MQPQDAGKYVVKAVNSGGEAQSIADLAVVENTPDRTIQLTQSANFNTTPNGFHKVSIAVLQFILL